MLPEMKADCAATVLCLHLKFRSGLSTSATVPVMVVFLCGLLHPT